MRYWLLFAWLLALPAQAQTLDIHVIAGKQMLAPGVNGLPSVVSRLITAWRGPAGWNLVPHLVDDLRQAQKTLGILNKMEPDPAHPVLVIAVLSSRLLDIAGGEISLGVAGATQPFADIPETLKGRGRVRRDRVLWVAIGWIPWNDFDTLRPPGGCAPSFTWERCVVQNGPDDFTISQRAGDHGWPLFGAAVVNTPANVAAEADSFMDFVVSVKASVALRDEFVVVAHPTVRHRRSVAFQLFGAGAGPVLATAIDAPDPLPRPQIDAVTGTFNACGAANTCPNYLPPPGTEAAFHEVVNAALK
jgi:hypothetical protein